MSTEKVEIDVSGLSLMIAMPVIGQIDPRCEASHINAIVALERRGIPWFWKPLVGCSLLNKARSLLVEGFLKSECNRLLMIDADQTFTADDVLKLLALSTKLPVVCGAYPAKLEPPTFLVATTHRSLPPGPMGTLQVDGLGLGFSMFDRKVLAQLETSVPRAKYDGDIETHPIFFSERIDDDGKFIGEDIAFFRDIKSLGYDVLIDPSLKIGHVGVKEYKADFCGAKVEAPGGILL